MEFCCLPVQNFKSFAQAPDPDVMLFKQGLDLRLKAAGAVDFPRGFWAETGIRGRLQAHSADKTSARFRL